MTVNLPKTDFPARAGLATLEPAYLASWPQYADPETPTYYLHDGPPYPNGPIHTGHALNKIVKDCVARIQRMRGHAVSFRPGWDCHGLPIETQVLKKQAGRTHALDSDAFRQTCAAFAQEHVERQKADFKRLGIDADWENPYLTLQPEYMAGVIQLVQDLVDQNLIYYGRKPIHWCIHCRTALADAEINYAPHTSHTMTVKFKLVTPPIDAQKPVYALVWTTTPWTLPANVGLAVNPEHAYVFIDTGDSIAVMAADADRVAGPVIHTCMGRDLIYGEATHPFLDKRVPLGGAAFVTATDGTGIVHIAPGHGDVDHQLGMQLNWPVLMPVGDDGCYTTGLFTGQSILEIAPVIEAELIKRQTLANQAKRQHSYPHCWRCQQPVIVRATPQWFIALDRPLKTGETLRHATLRALDTIQWVPEAGHNRMKAMIENRPDWCLSRQRYWGIPIPLNQCGACGYFTADRQSVRCPECDSLLEPVQDILDVWFESGSSFMLSDTPADCVIEGSDQHRGWFQAALLLSVATRNHAPFKTVMTHGFIVDDSGRKMSKSAGNSTQPDKIIQTYGADVLRWWVASVDVCHDVALSTAVLDQAKASFLKIRNTARFLLGVTSDYTDYTGDFPSELPFFERWILGKAQVMHDAVVQAYAAYDIHRATQLIYHFCATDLSQHFCDGRKDRLYCDAADSPERRATQVALLGVLALLVRVLAPVLVFTAEAIYQQLPAWLRPASSVHALAFKPAGYYDTEESKYERETVWPLILKLKEQVYHQGEVLRQQKVIKQFLELTVHITLPRHSKVLATVSDWEAILLVASVTCQVEDCSEASVRIQKSDHHKCDRCWRYRRLENGHCDRCSDVIKQETT